ncbi:hypothetical protein [Amycolatopsis sacchari]|uniref:Ribosomal protein L7/L12 C-terminal domain-containing protein n=1 Tax=Amycolatopsis sacchari TaxID=115433 RepID=A0A1I3R3H6_9PSEU|nr:hypothetical protein [Amycolatopsis sacchari]SFJ41104.1 hypothetical protein SAMN05421835_105132 [Amycolatopsis sacchari]
MDTGTVLLGLAVVLGVVLLAAWEAARRHQRTERRLAAVERKLDAVLDHLGVDVTEEHPEVEEFLRQGKRVEAIKAYRESTGADLREAVAAVDRLASRD